VAQLLGPTAQAALAREEELAAERAVRAQPGPLATLVRLLLLGRPVRRGALDAALPALGTAGAEGLGLVSASGVAPDDEARPLLELAPYAADDDEWWLASDLTRPAEQARPLRPDHVLGVGGASTTLARWTPRRPARRAADIGTGCGIQAFHLATHSADVVATDVSARSVAMAAFNAGLNAAVRGGPFDGRRLDLRRGSLLDPLAGERFDLVVSNPPYVITPRSGGAPAYTYRDGGLAGDDVVRRLVEDVGPLLEPGGTAQLLGNWEHRRGEPWAERVGAWLEASGLHGWVVQRELQDPAEYAETWARDAGHQPGSAAYTAMYAAWLDDFARRGVEAVGFGVVTLRRPLLDGGAVTRVRRVEEHTGSLDGAMGDVVAAVMDAEVWLLSADDADLLAGRWRVAADVTEERHGRPGAPDPSVIRLHQGGGLRRTVGADTALAAVVGACDGELPLGVLVDAVAGLLDEDAPALRQRVVPAVRRLVADGLLLGPSPGPLDAAFRHPG
jgi:methylase of polypeptide subunit release factors